jgi:hypothetical protein
MSKKVFLAFMFFLLFPVFVNAEEESSWLESEKIGEFSTGMKEQVLKKKLACNFKRGKEELWGADGLYHQSWDCLAAGISFEMSSERKGGKKSIDKIIVKAPSKLKTKRGIQIGSSEAEVIQAYNDVKDVQGTVPKETFVAGSVYGGLFFDFQDGRVSSIMLGAGAE